MWFWIVLGVIVYLVLGGAVKGIAWKFDLQHDILEDVSPIVIVLGWPFFVLVGVFLLVVVGSAMAGEAIMNWIIKQFEPPKEEEEEEKK